MWRAIIVLMAGAFLVGCENSPVQGDYAYRSDSNADGDSGRRVTGSTDYGSDRISGEKAYRSHEVSGEKAYRHTDEAARTAADKSDLTRSNPEAPNRAADAVGYPIDLRASDDLRATVLVDPAADTVKIANASDRDLRDAKIWIDRSFVASAAQIPAHGTITLQRGDFLNRDQKPLTDLKSVSQFQLATADKLYNLQGPVFDKR